MMRTLTANEEQVLMGKVDGEELIPVEMWERIVSLLPTPKPRRSHHPGRKPLDNRKALAGILYVLWTGIPWDALPTRLGCGTGLNCLRRLHAWQDEGAWPKIREAIEGEWSGVPRFDFDRADEHRFFLEDMPIHAMRSTASRQTV